MNCPRVNHRWSGFLLLFLAVVMLQAAGEGLRKPGAGEALPGGSDDIRVQGEMTAFTKMTLGIPLSLNDESEEGFTALPGIGRGLARAIVDVRDRRGGFKNIDEILRVKGLGRNLFLRIRPYLTL